MFLIPYFVIVHVSSCNFNRDPTPSQFGFKWELSTKDELKNYEIREQLSRVAYHKHKV